MADCVRAVSPPSLDQQWAIKARSPGWHVVGGMLFHDGVLDEIGTQKMVSGIDESGEQESARSAELRMPIRLSATPSTEQLIAQAPISISQRHQWRVAATLKQSPHNMKGVFAHWRNKIGPVGAAMEGACPRRVERVPRRHELRSQSPCPHRPLPVSLRSRGEETRQMSGCLIDIIIENARQTRRA